MLKQVAGSILIYVMVLASMIAHAAEAYMQVLESNVPAIQVGASVTESEMEALPTGARVKVLLPTLKTKVFKGPTVGPARTWGGTRGPRRPDR